MTDRFQRATEKFGQSYNCAQSVLYAFCEDLHLDPEVALKLACSFGGGMARKQEVCGAVSGGLMVLGLKYGRGANDDRRVTEATYTKARDLMNRFEEKHGSYLCRHLIEGCDLMTEEGQKTFKEKGFQKMCTEYVQAVVGILEQILKE